MSQSLRKTKRAGARAVPRQLSVPLVTVAVTAFAGGVAAGGVWYTRRTAEPAGAGDGSATGVHVMVALVALAWYLAARWRRAGQPARRGRLLLLAPFGDRAEQRIRRTAAAACRSVGALVRVSLAVPFVVVMLGGAFRAGFQVVAGLDPDFTADSWGGPSYLGAMAFHYLDVGLIVAAAGVVLNRLLPESPSVESGT